MSLSHPYHWGSLPKNVDSMDQFLHGSSSTGGGQESALQGASGVTATKPTQYCIETQRWWGCRATWVTTPTKWEDSTKETPWYETWLEYSLHFCCLQFSSGYLEPFCILGQDHWEQRAETWPVQPHWSNHPVSLQKQEISLQVTSTVITKA